MFVLIYAINYYYYYLTIHCIADFQVLVELLVTCIYRKLVSLSINILLFMWQRTYYNKSWL